MFLQLRTPLKIILNPNAGTARKLQIQDDVESYLHREGIEFEWSSIRELRSLAQRTQLHHFVLVIGGDGTLHSVLNAIGFHNLNRFSFAIVPAGTGNDFARSLEIPLNLEKALETLTKGEPGYVDLGVINNRVCFTCAASLGFGPEVTKHASRCLKFLFGRWALYLGAFFYWFLPKPVFKIKANMNQRHEMLLQTPHLVIGNGKYHGGGVPISPTADLQNTQLDLYYLKPIGLGRITKLLMKVLAKRDHTSFEEVTHRQVQEIMMTLNEPVEVDVDGDIYTFYRRIHAKVHPGKLRVMMPRHKALNNKLVKDPAWNLVSRDSRAS